MVFDAQHAAYIGACEAALQQAAENYFQNDSIVSAAALYSLLNGGKRVRGVFVLAVCDMLDGNLQVAGQFAAALEMVHAFSLIHDDLPCMDDDDMRRGKPSCHKAYGEANALLAGDLLALQAFDVLAGSGAGAQQLVQAVAVLAGCAGAKGMIYGQELDLYYENREVSLEQLELIHKKKTGELFKASIQLGILAAGHTPAQQAGLLEYASNIGSAFQVVDDILDVTSSTEVLGKPVGSDAQQGKNTYVTLLGLAAAKQKALQQTKAAIEALQPYGEKAAFLQQFATKLAGRVQ